MRVKSVFEAMPGVGPRISEDLESLGFSDIFELAGADPEELYARLEELAGAHVDRCMLYVLRMAVDYARTGGARPGGYRWWDYKDNGPRAPESRGGF